MGKEKIDDLDDFGPEDGPLTRRQSAPAPSKSRPRRSPWVRFRIAATVIGILGVTGAAAYFVTRFALDDDRFRMASVTLRGATFVNAAEVEEKFSGDKDQSILRVPLDERRSQIEQIRWVRTASVRRVLPNQLLVTVRERVPVAFVAKTDGLALVDEDGVILDSPKDAVFQFPVVRGLSEKEPPSARRAKMKTFSALMKDLERGGLQSNDMVSEVDLQDPDDARMIVSGVSGTLLLHLGSEKFLDRYMIYSTHIAEWTEKFPHIQSVDLRYAGQVVINSESPPDPKRTTKGPLQSRSQPVLKAAAKTKH